MKIKSLFVILLLSLFTLALEAQVFVEGSADIVLVDKQVNETPDVAEEIDDDDRLFFDLENGMVYCHKPVKKIDFHNNLPKEEFSAEVHKPPIV